MNKRSIDARWLRLIACVAMLTIIGIVDKGFAAEKVVVIANKSLSASSLSKSDLKQIALGERTTDSKNETITFVILEQGPVHEEFLKAYIEKSSFQYSSIRKQMIFTGKGTPPRAFKSEAELISFVAATKGAVGFVSGTADVSSVKVIDIQ